MNENKPNPALLNLENMKRFEIYTGSQTAHCCFKYTVVDTTKPYFIGGDHYKDRTGQYQFDQLCECFDYESAEMIVNVLNKTYKLKD